VKERNGGTPFTPDAHVSTAMRDQRMKKEKELEKND